MGWLVPGIIIAGIVFWLVRRRRVEEKSPDRPVSAPQIMVLPDEGEILAVITAAIAEFEGEGNFQVVSVRPCNRNWTLVGRQELMRSRL